MNRGTILALAALWLAPPSLVAEEGDGPGFRAVVFSPDGKSVAASAGEPEEKGILVVWDVSARKPLWEHREPAGIPSLAFAPDSKTLAVANFAPEAKLLDAATGKVRATFGGHGKAARAVAFSPDGETLAVGSYDRFINLWDVAKGTVRKTLQGHKGRVMSLAFSPDGKRLLSAGDDGARLWDVGKGKEEHHWPHRGSAARCVTFSPDGRWAVVGGYSGIDVWDARTGESRVKTQHLGGAEGIAFDPAGRILAVGSPFGNEVRLIELTLREPEEGERKEIRRLLAQLDDDAIEVREAAGKKLLETGFVAEPFLRKAMKESGSAEVRIRCRRLRQEMLSRPRATLAGHEGYALAVAFSPDGRGGVTPPLLASASKDGTVRLWDVAARKELARLRPPKPQ